MQRDNYMVMCEDSYPGLQHSDRLQGKLYFD